MQTSFPARYAEWRVDISSLATDSVSIHQYTCRAFVSPFTNTALDYYQYFMPRCPVSHSQVPGISWALLHNSLTQKLTLQAVPAKSLAWKNRKTTHKNLKAQGLSLYLHSI
ncbi:hypothetical protein NXS19_003688 [Fusarium pseudograminearum]|nr:hypothetical protein NXS19_003688 [Fusarium pseudograminearum]